MTSPLSQVWERVRVGRARKGEETRSSNGGQYRTPFAQTQESKRARVRKRSYAAVATLFNRVRCRVAEKLSI